MSIWRRRQEVAAQRKEDARFAFVHRLDRFDGVVAEFAGGLEGKFFVELVEEWSRGAFPDAHGAVALHVAVAAHWAQATPGSTDLAGEQVEVDQFLNGFDGVVVLGEPHGPARDRFFGRDEDVRDFADLILR